MAKNLGCLVVDIEGTELSAEDKDILSHPLVGGVILFARNYEHPEQLSRLVASMRAACTTPLLIMVDQEGGRVQRFKAGFTTLPPAAHFGNVYDENAEQGQQAAYTAGHLMATELLAHDIDFSIAPVLDLNQPNCSVIGDRAFHHTPAGVINLATAYMRGMHAAGMASVGKHFPGHGSVSVDSHVGFPVDERTLSELEQADLYPFMQLVRNGIRAMLASHVLFPKVDSDPAGYSRYWLTEILRKKIGFDGPILTDDLSMEGANISASYPDRVIKAREAGCDFALVCNHRAAVINVLDTLPHTHHVPSEKWQILIRQFRKEMVTSK